MIGRIREIIFSNAEINEEDSLILGLIEACKMHHIVSNNKHETRICRKRLDEIVKSDAIAQGVNRVINEMQAAIIGALVASTVATTASSH